MRPALFQRLAQLADLDIWRLSFSGRARCASTFTGRAPFCAAHFGALAAARRRKCRPGREKEFLGPGMYFAQVDAIYGPLWTRSKITPGIWASSRSDSAPRTPACYTFTNYAGRRGSFVHVADVNGPGRLGSGTGSSVPSADISHQRPPERFFMEHGCPCAAGSERCGGLPARSPEPAPWGSSESWALAATRQPG